MPRVNEWIAMATRAIEMIDQSLYRSALQGGNYQMLTAAVPASNLVAGANTATFTMNTKGSAGAGLYYDVVTFESD